MKLKSVAFLVVLLLSNNLQASGDTVVPVKALKGYQQIPGRLFMRKHFKELFSKIRLYVGEGMVHPSPYLVK